MGGGHYTAYAKNLINHEWYELDDASATRITKVQSIKSRAAYVSQQEQGEKETLCHIDQSLIHYCRASLCLSILFLHRCCSIDEREPRFKTHC